VLEGFETWAKISNVLRDTDVVVVVTSHISHDNMWRVKKEITIFLLSIQNLTSKQNIGEGDCSGEQLRDFLI